MLYGVTPEFIFLTDCVVFCRLLFVLLSYLFWQLYCLSFDLRLLISPLVSSTFSSCPSDICNFRRFSLVAFKLFGFLIFGCLSLLYEGYYRNLCALNEISTYLFRSSSISLHIYQSLIASEIPKCTTHLWVGWRILKFVSTI
jgi:hypothetical protein